MENLVRFDPTTPDGMLAQLVERALSMCKVRSSTLLHSTIFFWCCGVGGVLRGAKNNKQHRVFDSKEEDKYMMSSNAKEVREAFFFTYEFFFLREVSFLQLLQYYDELRIIIMYHTCVLPSIIISISIIHTILLYLSRVVLFDVPVAQKRRHSERKVGWIFFYVKLEIFLQTFRLFLPGRVVFVQRNRTLRLVVVKQ